jgi:protein TonB
MKAKEAILSAVAGWASIWSTAALADQPRPVAADQWVTAADNLPEASRLGLDGRVFVELDVSAEGRVTGCRVVKSSGHSLLDNHTCQLLSSRAQFKPATGENGRPVAGTFAHSIGWQDITTANWAANGIVKAEMIIDPVAGQGTECAAKTIGEISDHMEQLGCFVLVNQARSLLAALMEERKAPFMATFVLAVYPVDGRAFSEEESNIDGQRVAYANATVVVSPAGLRSDCRMAQTEGPSTLIFPICGQVPQFRYVPAKDASGENVPTELRQEVAYYVESM